MIQEKMRKKSLTIAKTCILGKVYNSRWVLERAVRDHAMQIDAEKVKAASMQLKASWSGFKTVHPRIS